MLCFGSGGHSSIQCWRPALGRNHVEPHLCIVVLQNSRRAPASVDTPLQFDRELADDFGILSCYIVLFCNIVGEIIELDDSWLSARIGHCGGWHLEYNLPGVFPVGKLSVNRVANQVVTCITFGF